MDAVETRPGVRRFVDVAGLRLSYLEWGPSDAQPVVLLHGFSGAAWTWEEVATALASDHRVIALDGRGHGHSAWHPGGDYAYESFVDDLKGVVDSLRLTNVILIGHSMGALHATPFAAWHPSTLAALVLVDCGPRPAADVAATAEAFWKIPLEFDSWDEAVAYQRSRAAQAGAISSERLSRIVDESFIRQPGGRVTWRWDLAGLQRKRREYDPLMVGDGQWTAVRALQVPTLLLRGGKSNVLPATIALRMTELNPRIQLVEFPEAGHSIHTDDFAGFMRALRPFIAEHRTRR